MKFCTNMPDYASSKRTGLNMWLCVMAFFLMAGPVYAQDPVPANEEEVTIEREEASALPGPDTVQIKSYASRYDPRKAILFAAIMPGLGQIYNKKYWKLPLVYGGFYAIGYGLHWYDGLHKEYRGYLFQNLEAGLGENEEIQNPPPKLRGYTTSQLRTLVEKARRERDFMIILMGGMYILQMIDAHVDAHLKEFEVNPRLQVSIEPSIDSNYMTGRTTGVSLVVRF